MSLSDAASTTFFQIPELVDLVFEHLDKRTLLRVVRACQLFKWRIHHVKAVRRRLFLYAETTDIIANSHEKAGWPALKLNPFLYHITAVHRGPFFSSQDSAPVRLPYPHQLTVSPDTHLRWNIHRTCYLLLVPTGLKQDIKDKPTYRDMYLTRPPITQVLVCFPDKVAIDHGNFVQGEITWNTLRNDSGIKIGEVIDAILEYADSEYLQVAPYAVQTIYPNMPKDGFKQYKSRVTQHYLDWRREFGLWSDDQPVTSEVGD